VQRTTPAGLVVVLGLTLGLVGPGCGSREGGSPPGSGGSAGERRPDIVLLSVDTLRPDHLGAWGYARDTSPFFDELAGRGTRFANAWAPSPWTLPSHATMLTGLFPHHHGAERSELTIDRRAPLLAEMLLAAGYATCGVVTSIFVSDKYGFGRGFEHFDDFGILAGTRDTKEAPDAAEVFDRGLRWAQEQPQDTPLFLFVHVYDVHYPYAAPSPWDERYDRPSRPDELGYENYFYYLRHPLSDEEMEHQRDQYDEEIAYVDAMFHDFVDRWTAARPRTLFVMVSDHGEELGDRGSWGHAHTLGPEQLHVPWIMVGPSVRAQVVSQRVGLEDLPATLASMAGVSFPAGDGIDRSTQLQQGTIVGEDAVAARLATTYRFKTIKHRWHDPPYDLVVDLARLQAALFDLEQDPEGLHDVLAEHELRARRMMQEMFEWLGQPWEVRRDGHLQTDGVFVVDGVRQNQEIDLKAGSRFALFPLDATVTFVAADGGTGGPYAAAGGVLPADGDPNLSWNGQPLDTGAAGLTEEQRERLRALGYLD
jgi:arylsulfatase A-like enzyme